MSYFLFATILVALVAILYVWYVTRGLNSIPDDKPILLDTDDDKLLVYWYKMHIKESYDFNTNDSEAAAKYLKRIHDIEINPGLLVLGTDLDNQYFNITRTHLNIKYLDTSNQTNFTQSENLFQTNVDYLFDIRSTIGKSGEIAIINNSRVRENLQRNNNLDFTEISSIINSDLGTIANNYLREVLKFRWTQILELKDPSLLNSCGSFLYLRTLKDTTSGVPVSVLGERVTALMTSQGARLNLLCSNYEFEALIKRWKEYLSNNIELAI